MAIVSLNDYARITNSVLDLTEKVIYDITDVTIAMSINGAAYVELNDECKLTLDSEAVEEGDVETYSISYNYLVRAPLAVGDTIVFRLTPSDAGSVGTDPFYTETFTVIEAYSSSNRGMRFRLSLRL